MSIHEQSDGVLEFWNAIRPKVQELIGSMTQNCVRARRAVVVTPANAETGKMEVQLPFDTQVLSLPYSSAVASLPAGSQVWLLIPFDNTLSNAVVVQNGTWTL